MTQPSNGLAVACFVLGIVAVGFCAWVGAGLFAMASGFVSLGFGIAALRPARTGRRSRLAMVGVVLAVVGIWYGYRGLTAEVRLRRAVIHALNTPVVDASVGKVRVMRCGDKGDGSVAFGSVTNNTRQERALKAAIAFKTSAGATQFTAVESVGLVRPGETAYWAIHDDTGFKPAACTVVMSVKPKP